MSDVTAQINNENFKSFDFDLSKIFIWGNSYKSGTFKNNTGGASAFEAGTILGRDSSDGTLVALDLTNAVNGEDIPVGVLAQDIASIANAATVDDVNFGVKGEVAKEKVVLFDGADALTSACSDARTIEDHLVAVGIILKDTDELTGYDNA